MRKQKIEYLLFHWDICNQWYYTKFLIRFFFKSLTAKLQSLSQLRKTMSLKLFILVNNSQMPNTSFPNISPTISPSDLATLKSQNPSLRLKTDRHKIYKLRDSPKNRGARRCQDRFRKKESPWPLIACHCADIQQGSNPKEWKPCQIPRSVAAISISNLRRRQVAWILEVLFFFFLARLLNSHLLILIPK